MKIGKKGSAHSSSKSDSKETKASDGSFEQKLQGASNIPEVMMPLVDETRPAPTFARGESPKDMIDEIMMEKGHLLPNEAARRRLRQVLTQMVGTDPHLKSIVDEMAE